MRTKSLLSRSNPYTYHVSMHVKYIKLLKKSEKNIDLKMVNLVNKPII